MNRPDLILHRPHQQGADTAAGIAARCTGLALAAMLVFASTYGFLSWAINRIDIAHAFCIENADCYQRHCVQTRTCLADRADHARTLSEATAAEAFIQHSP